MVDIVLPERPLRDAMVDYSWRILDALDRAVVDRGGAVSMGLQRMIVMPLRRITEA